MQAFLNQSGIADTGYSEPKWDGGCRLFWTIVEWRILVIGTWQCLSTEDRIPAFQRNEFPDDRIPAEKALLSLFLGASTKGNGGASGGGGGGDANGVGGGSGGGGGRDGGGWVIVQRWKHRQWLMTRCKTASNLLFIQILNIDHWQNYKYWEWGKILNFEKNQTFPLLFLMSLIFFKMQNFQKNFQYL